MWLGAQTTYAVENPCIKSPFCIGGLPTDDGKLVSINLLMSRPQNPFFITIASLILKDNLCISLVIVTNVLVGVKKTEPKGNHQVNDR